MMGGQAMQFARHVLIALSLYFPAAAFGQANAPAATNSRIDPASPHGIIARLADNIYVAGETSASGFATAFQQRRADLQAFMQANPDSEQLVEQHPRSGYTPLQSAAGYGYAEIVEELLKSQRVLQHLNDTDRNGLTAWAQASLAFRISIWACNPKIWDNPLRMIPYFVTHPVYTEGNGARYRHTRALLEQAGAIRDSEVPRAFWQKSCVNQTPEIRAKMAAATDPLDVAVDEGIAALYAGLLEIQQKKIKQQP